MFHEFIHELGCTKVPDGEQVLNNVTAAAAGKLQRLPLACREGGPAAAGSHGAAARGCGVFNNLCGTPPAPHSGRSRRAVRRRRQRRPVQSTGTGTRSRQIA